MPPKTLTLLVEVTPEHIAKGRPGLAGFCPIAYALREATLEQYMVVVGPMTAVLQRGANIPNLRALLPAEAMTFVYRFDRGKKVEPAIFELEFKESPLYA